MAPLLSFFLTLTLTLMLLANNVRSQGDVTSFQIDSFSPTSDGLTYERDAFVPPGSSHLSLVGADSSGRPRSSSVGRVLYSTPVNFWEPEEQGKPRRQASFETTIKFNLTSVDGVPPGDGMTFFIIPADSTRSSTGGSGGGLGIYGVVNPNVLFAVEFDLYSNPVDPSFPHVGINFVNQTSASFISFENAMGTEVTARINYEASTRRINVVTMYNSQTSTVSHTYDLKTLLPQQVLVGISASTGSALANFDVFSWYFTSSLVWDGGNTFIKQIVM